MGYLAAGNFAVHSVQHFVVCVKEENKFSFQKLMKIIQSQIITLIHLFQMHFPFVVVVVVAVVIELVVVWCVHYHLDFCLCFVLVLMS